MDRRSGAGQACAAALCGGVQRPAASARQKTEEIRKGALFRTFAECDCRRPTTTTTTTMTTTRIAIGIGIAIAFSISKSKSILLQSSVYDGRLSSVDGPRRMSIYTRLPVRRVQICRYVVFPYNSDERYRWRSRGGFVEEKLRFFFFFFVFFLFSFRRRPPLPRRL